MDARNDIFPKVTDRRDIVDFVKEVEKYPCLYNKTLPEYANKVHNRRAWSAIAKRSNTSIPDCRDKWRKIRISYMRSLKQQVSDKPPMRPYYLTEVLHFLTPFLSVRPKTQNGAKDIDPKDDMMEFEINAVEKQEISDTNSNSSVCSDPETEDQQVREITRVTINDNTIPNIMNGRIENNRINQNSGRNSYSDDNNMECTPRKMFLLSMLPDIESMSESEMRVFRREVISIVDKIISNRGIGY
uniref:MADF domain-containing protein n=1 Tax=Heliothis virescens TaxID=7102 RepID=A0A2A4JSI4_HELVI